MTVKRFAVKPLFKRSLRDQYIAVKPIQHRGKEITPGDSVSHLKIHHLMSLWQRNRIGLKDYPWTLRALAAWHSKRGNRDKVAELYKAAEDLLKANSPDNASILKAWWDSFGDKVEGGEVQNSTEKPEPTTTDDDEDWDTVDEVKVRPTPTKSGSQWVIDGIEDKHTSKKKALAAWDAKHGPKS